MADAQPAARPPGPGQFQYTDSRALNGVCNDDRKGSYCVNYVEYRQIWIGSDGSGRLVQHDVHPSWPAPRDRDRWIAAGRPSLRAAPMNGTFGPGGLSDGPGRNLWKLTTNPAKLAALIAARKIEGGPPGPAEDFSQVADLLRETDAPPALRSALFQVAAHLPGVTLLGAAPGYPAQSSIGITKYELIFSKRTSALLSERYVDISQRTGKSSLRSFTDYLASGVVDATTSTVPPGGAS